MIFVSIKMENSDKRTGVLIQQGSNAMLTYYRRFFSTKEEADDDIKNYSKLLQQSSVESRDNQAVRSILLGQLGEAYIHSDQFEKAKECLKSALEISKRNGDLENQANWIVSLGIVKFRETKDQEALILFEKALTVTSNYPQVEAVALTYAGRIHADLKHDETHNAYYAQARELAQICENKKLLSVVYY